MEERFNSKEAEDDEQWLMSKTHKIHTGKLNDSKDLKDILPNSASDSILDEEAAPEEEVNRSSN